MKIEKLKYAQRERVLFLDKCFTWRGQANRSDLEREFGVSTAQAALDFKEYLKLNYETPPRYDANKKTYVAGSNFEPLTQTQVISNLNILSPNLDEIASLPQPTKSQDPNVISRIFMALQSGQKIQLNYVSMTTGDKHPQWLAPTNFFTDGQSVYFRAFSFRHKCFRTYSPVRVHYSSTFEKKELENQLESDEEWETKLRIWLKPKDTLSKEQAEAVRKEYAFEGDFLKLETRKPLEFFLDRRWGLDQAHSRLERFKAEII